MMAMPSVPSTSIAAAGKSAGRPAMAHAFYTIPDYLQALLQRDSSYYESLRATLFSALCLSHSYCEC